MQPHVDNAPAQSLQQLGQEPKSQAKQQSMMTGGRSIRHRILQSLEATERTNKQKGEKGSLRREQSNARHETRRSLKKLGDPTLSACDRTYYEGRLERYQKKALDLRQQRIEAGENVRASDLQDMDSNYAHKRPQLIAQPHPFPRPQLAEEPHLPPRLLALLQP